MGTGFLQHHHHGGSHPNAMITGGGGAQVGEHIIQCTVSRLASSVSRYAGDDDNETTTTTTVSGDIATQCYHIPFTITDTNECLLPPGHVMYHQCDESTICVNTIGSYECVCPTIRKKSKLRLEQGETITDPNRWKEIQNIQERGPWEVSYKLPGQSSCPFLPSTYQCCPSVERNTNGGGDGGETTSCRGSFKCPIDPCSKSYFNDCSAAATCQRNNAPTRRIAIPTTSTAMMSGPKDYTCSCPKGYMGNGHVCRPNDPKPIPKVMYDGVTPTELTLKHNLYCDCTIPLVDICAGYPPCEGMCKMHCVVKKHI